MKRVSEVNDGDTMEPVLIDGVDLVIVPNGPIDLTWWWFRITGPDGTTWARSLDVIRRAAEQQWPVSRYGLDLIADYARELVLEEATKR